MIKARVTVTLKNGVLDPQGKAIEGALGSLGFDGVGQVRQGKVFDLELATADRAYVGPTALVLAEREFERVEPGAPWFRTWGDPAVVFNLRLARADVAGSIGLAHGPRALGDGCLPPPECEEERVADSVGASAHLPSGVRTSARAVRVAAHDRGRREV